jgi:hypothetical protein
MRRANKRLKLSGGEGCAPSRPLEARGFLSRRPQLKRVLDRPETTQGSVA